MINSFKKFVLIISTLLLIFSCGDGGSEDPVVDAVKVSIVEISVDEGEDDSNTFVRIRLNKETQTLVTAYISSVDGTATAGEDYVGFSNVPIVFEPGDKNKDYSVQILGDTDSETDEYFEITITNLEGNAETDLGTAKVNIINDDREPTSFTIPTTGPDSPTSYPGMSLLWADEFEGPGINNDNWTFEIGSGDWGWGNNELQYYTRGENASIVDGNLIIEAREDDTRRFTSTRMITKGKFDFQYGRVDIRAALPKGQGIWPALWMLGSNISTVGWPACGEIDIMELLGHQPNKVHGTAHWSDNSDHKSYGKSKTLSGTRTFNDDFHVFSIIWTENSIKWLLDDVQYNELNISSAGLSELQKNQFFIFNVAVGGNWPGNPDATTPFPQQMIVDYIRVFQ